MNKTELKEGDVVVISYDSKNINPIFAGCLMTVTDPKPWGAQGYVQSLGEKGKAGGKAYYRCNFEDMEFVGVNHWRIENES